MNDLKGLKYVDLFAGIGGFHIAMDYYGADCVFASEWDCHAKRTYFDNFGLEPEGDITKIHEKNIPSHDILCAGFPCQAFSISGKQRGFEDARGTLFFDIARIARYHNPKILFLENVQNLVKHNSGRTLETIISILTQVGYNVFFKSLNASNFLLPQNRERIFFVCFREDLNVGQFAFPIPSNKSVALVDILENNPKDAKIIQRNDIVFTKSYTPDTDIFGEKLLPNRPVQIGYVNKGGQGERIYSPYGHSITLSAYGGGVGAKTGLYLIDGVVRKLSPRECARLQGFPDSFQLNSSVAQCYKQFGNSVAVNVLKAIIYEIINSNCMHSNHNIKSKAV